MFVIVIRFIIINCFYHCYRLYPSNPSGATMQLGPLRVVGAAVRLVGTYQLDFALDLSSMKTIKLFPCHVDITPKEQHIAKVF